jgi:hypothetical protein
MTNRFLLFRCLILVAIACATFFAAHYVRHQLIEPVAMGAICEKSAGWANLQCSLRHIAIFALQDSRLGWGALALVGVAYLTGSFAVALLAWCLASIGLVLYTPELCAVTLLFAGLLCMRTNQRDRHTGAVIQSQ